MIRLRLKLILCGGAVAIAGALVIGVTATAASGASQPLPAPSSSTTGDGANPLTNYPPVATIPAGGQLITEAQAIASAERASSAVRDDGVSTAITAPTLAQQMSFADADKLVQTGESGVVAADRSVWVVTVHAPMMTMGSPQNAPVEKSVYTVVFDAYSGYPIDLAIGVDSLTK